MRRFSVALLLAAASLTAGIRDAPAEPVSIAILRLASSGGVFIAREKGYFAEEGIDLDLKFLEAAQPIAVAVVAGDADFGITGLTAGFYNLAGKGALRIIAGQSREEPGYHLIAYLASNPAYEGGLAALAALPGHSVAITQAGSTFHYSLGLLSEKLGFDLSRLRLVALQSMPNMAAALKGGQIDAALIPGTIAVPMVSRGEAHLLGWVGDETPWQLGALFTTARLLGARAPLAARFIKAYRRGARDFYAAFLTRGPDGAPIEREEAGALLQVLATYTGQPVEQIRGALPYVDPEAGLLTDDIAHQIRWYQGQGLVDRAVTVEGVVDGRFLDSAGAGVRPAASERSPPR